MQVFGPCQASILGSCGLGWGVAARHRDRAAGDRRRARPRLSARPRPDRGRSAPSRSAAIASTTSCSASSDVPADERVEVRQRRRHPAGARRRSPRAATRGLTHTIRYASRARRSISRPTSAGSPRSQPSERITTTAPRAIPRRPWRSLNARSASPMRVPRDQSGAAAAARWIARSGERVASARVTRVSRVANTNASAFVPRGAGQELQVGPRVGLHRARDVAQQHEPARHDAAAAVGEPDRVAAGAQASRAACGAGRRARRGGRARPGACAASASPSRSRAISAYSARQLAGLQRVEALGAQRSSSLAGTGIGTLASSVGLASPARATRGEPPGAPSPPLRRDGARRAVVGAATLRVSSGSSTGGVDRVRAEDLDRTPRRTPAPGARSVTSAARAVQYSRRRAIGRTSASASAKRAARSGVTGTPASCSRRAERGHQRRQVELDGLELDRSPGSRAPAGADDSWSSAYLSTEPSVRSTAVASSVSNAEQLERGQPVDRLGDARAASGCRESRIVATASTTCTASDSARARARAGARSRARAPGVG